MNKIFQKTINVISNSSTKKIFGICSILSIICIVISTIIPQDGQTLSFISNLLFASAFLILGLAGIPIIIRKEYPFAILYKYSQLEAVMYGWIFLIIGVGMFILFMFA